MKIYTRAGDDGTTGLYFGGRIEKDSAVIWTNGQVDEAQAALGFARSFAKELPEINELLVSLERDLWVLMSEVATAPENRHKLKGGATLVTTEMVERLEGEIDRLAAITEWPREFVVPGETTLSAALDVARTVIRRAERSAVSAVAPDSLVVTYLNRLSDVVWALARHVEGHDHLTARSISTDEENS